MFPDKAGGMNPIWLMLLVLVAFLIVLRLKKRGRRKLRTPVYSRRIEGFQVVAALEPEMPSACLFDHGVQFGRGFRRKEGPALPHDERCKCSTLPFSFTSNEVFNGALRTFAEIRNEVQGLDQPSANRLVDQLRRTESGPLPPTLEAYLARMDLDEFHERAQALVRVFLTQRYAFLRAGGSQPQRAPGGDLAAGS
jgi:hypothetical protein